MTLTLKHVILNYIYNFCIFSLCLQKLAHIKVKFFLIYIKHFKLIRSGKSYHGWELVTEVKR